MVPWFVAGIVALIVAFKFVAVGAIVVACIVVWAIFRLLFRTVGAVSGRPFGRHRIPDEFVHAASSQRPPCRYDEVRPVVHVVSAVPTASVTKSSHCRRSSTWVVWLVLGLAAAFVFSSVRSRSRNSAEPRTAKVRFEQPQFVQAAEKPKKRATKPTPAPADPTPPKRVVEAAPSEPEASWMIVGRGETVDDAKDDACVKAREELLVFLRNQNPPIEWTPSRDFVRKHLARRWDSETYMHLDDVGEIVQIPLYLELTHADRELIGEHEKHYRVEARMTWLGKIFAGLVALLAAIAGYIRLDEWSKGYYTGALRAAAVAVVVASAAGMWFLARH